MSLLNHALSDNHTGARLSTLNHMCNARGMELEIFSPAKMPRQVAPGLVVKLPVVGHFTNLDIEGNRYNLDLVLDMTSEGIKPVDLRLRPDATAPGLTSTILRALKIGELTQQVLLRSVESGDVHSSDYEITIDSHGPVAELSEHDIQRIREQGPTDESLQWTANFYNLGQVLGLPPAKQVELNLGLPRTTASKWVRRAREKGLLVETISGERTPESVYTFETEPEKSKTQTYHDELAKLQKHIGTKNNGDN